jgi:Resolvase, N terminal domain
MERPKAPIRRCAIYTRKSSEEGLKQDFNSLQAQREACEAFIKSQAGEGWRLVKTAYDDGGLSGGTMERNRRCSVCSREKTQLLRRSHGVRRTLRATKPVASPLTGKLFDESGLSLTPSHAVKGERRDRYYLSRSLIRGSGDSTGRGWRLPAPEIERSVTAAACKMLSD